MSRYVVGTARLVFCLLVIMPVGIVVMVVAGVYEWTKNWVAG